MGTKDTAHEMHHLALAGAIRSLRNRVEDIEGLIAELETGGQLPQGSGEKVDTTRPTFKEVLENAPSEVAVLDKRLNDAVSNLRTILF